MTNSATASQTIAEQQAKVAKGKILGCTTFWSLRGFRVPRADFKAELGNIGLAAAYGRDMSPKAVLTRAVDSWLRGRKDLSVKRLKAGVALEHVAIVDGRVRRSHCWTVAALPNGALDFDQKDDSANVSQAFVAEMKARMEQCFQEVIDYATTTDLSAALTTAMQGTRKAPMLSACNLRDEAGGVYFVPAASLPIFNTFRDYIHANSDSNVRRFWISDVEDNAAEVSEGVKQTVEGELAELRSSVLAFAKECGEKGKDVGLKTINARAKRYDDLRVKVDLWADMLGDVATEMRAKIGEAAASLKSDLGTGAPIGMKSTPPDPESSAVDKIIAEKDAAQVVETVDENPTQFPEEPETEEPDGVELSEDVSDSEATGVLAQAQEMAKKITRSGFDVRVHFAKMGPSSIALLQIKDHPVMGTGVMTLRNGEAPEFVETQEPMDSDLLLELASEKLTA